MADTQGGVSNTNTASTRAASQTPNQAQMQADIEQLQQYIKAIEKIEVEAIQSVRVGVDTVIHEGLPDEMIAYTATADEHSDDGVVEATAHHVGTPADEAGTSTVHDTPAVAHEPDLSETSA